MIIFHSDLDNTLIYSYKHEIGSEKRCVELYRGRELSYMTEKSLELLERIRERVLFVPTTTRTVEQYDRIRLGTTRAAYALVCNGGILLENGREDDGWYQESLAGISDCAGELKNAERILEEDPDRNFELRFIRKLFIFTKSGNPCNTISRLKKALNLAQVDVFGNGAKVYVLPRYLNKGTAVLRFREKLKAERMIACGDSEFDIPMLDAADIPIAPRTLGAGQTLRPNWIYMPGERLYSEELLAYIWNIVYKLKEGCGHF